MASSAYYPHTGLIVEGISENPNKKQGHERFTISISDSPEALRTRRRAKSHRTDRKVKQLRADVELDCPQRELECRQLYFHAANTQLG